MKPNSDNRTSHLLYYYISDVRFLNVYFQSCCKSCLLTSDVYSSDQLQFVVAVASMVALVLCKNHASTNLKCLTNVLVRVNFNFIACGLLVLIYFSFPRILNVHRVYFINAVYKFR